MSLGRVFLTKRRLKSLGLFLALGTSFEKLEKQVNQKIFFHLISGAVEKSSKQGADHIAKAKLSHIREKMEQRCIEKYEIFEMIRYSQDRNLLLGV